MAEFMQFRTEIRMPELERLERFRLFEKQEFKTICKKRQELDYKIQRLSKRKDDYVQYIKYEMDLLNLIKQRKKKFETSTLISDVERALAEHISKLYSQAMFRFKEDVNIYIAYIKFCDKMNYVGLLHHILNNMLKVHSVKPAVWKFAATWELEQNQSKEKARAYLRQGIYCNPDSQMLYKQAFHLELAYAEDNRKEMESQGQSEQNKELLVLEGCLAEAMYESASKKINNITFYIELLEIAKEFSFTRNLQKKMALDLLRRYQTDECAWDVFARLQLEGLLCIDYSPSELEYSTSGDNLETDEEKGNSKVNLKEKIKHCCIVYMKAVQLLPTQRMWSLYLETLLELNRNLAQLPKLKKKLLFSALQSAHAVGLLQEKYYLQWAQLPQQKSVIDLILNHATCRFPLSVALWEKRLQLHLSEDEKSGALIFQEAIGALGNDSVVSLPLWKMYIQYWQTKSTAKVEEIFQECISTKRGHAVAYHLKPMYLEWLVLVKGIITARKVYISICKIPPLCIEVHRKMISLECMQPAFNLKQTRKCYELACKQFGRDNPDLWIDYIKLEKKRGDPKRVPDIYEQALEKLRSTHTDIFESEFLLVNSTVSPT